MDLVFGGVNVGRQVNLTLSQLCLRNHTPSAVLKDSFSAYYKGWNKTGTS